jgi:hypothetical protein
MRSMQAKRATISIAHGIPLVDFALIRHRARI